MCAVHRQFLKGLDWLRSRKLETRVFYLQTKSLGQFESVNELLPVILDAELVTDVVEKLNRLLVRLKVGDTVEAGFGHLIHHAAARLPPLDEPFEILVHLAMLAMLNLLLNGRRGFLLKLLWHLGEVHTSLL